MSELYASVASCKLPINDSFLSISLRNKTFNGVPEHVYIVDFFEINVENISNFR